MKTLEAIWCKNEMEPAEHERPANICVEFRYTAKLADFTRLEKGAYDRYQLYRESVHLDRGIREDLRSCKTRFSGERVTWRWIMEMNVVR